MSEPFFHVCTVERQREIAERFGIEYKAQFMSSITTAPDQMTDEQVATALRALAAIPEEEFK